MLLQDQIAVRGALVVERIVRHRGEGRLQRGEPLHRGLRPRIFLLVQREAAVLAIDRNKALVEMAVRDGMRRALLALEPKLVDVLTRDAFERRHGVRTDSLMRLRMSRAQA